MKCYSQLTIFVIIFFFSSIVLSISNNNVIITKSWFTKLVDKLTLRPLNVFSGVDFILDKSCKISPEKYFKSPNVILSCGLKENENVLITFNRNDKRVNIYQNNISIEKAFIKLGDNAKVELCIEKNETNSCRSIVFWVINEYENFHKNIPGYDEMKFNDDHFLNFLDGLNKNNGDINSSEDMTNASINYVVLEKNLDGEISKIVLSPIDGVINVNIEFGSKLILHLPQDQRKRNNIIDEIHNNSKNPLIIYFIDSKRLGFGPLSINILSPELINLVKDAKETKRSFLLGALNKNSNKRGFVLFVLNYIEKKHIANDCLEMVVDDTIPKDILIEKNGSKLISNVFKCFYDENNIDNNVENVSVNIVNSDGMALYVMKLSDINNTFLYFNDKLQKNGIYQHQIFLKAGQKELVEYTVKNRKGIVISKIRLTFSSMLCHRYVYYLSILIKYLTFFAISIDLKGVMDLWLFNRLASSIKGVPNEFLIISGQNVAIKKYDIVSRLCALITIDNELLDKSDIIYINESLYTFILSIVINITLLMIIFIVKCLKRNGKDIMKYYNILTSFSSLSLYTLIFTLSNSFNIITIAKFDVRIGELFVSGNMLKAFSVLWIITSLVIYKINNQSNRNMMEDIFTYSPWRDGKYILKFPGLPYFKTIQWPLKSIGETNIIKIEIGKSHFLIEYKLDIPYGKGIDCDMYNFSIISATYNEFNGTNLSNQINEKHTLILNTPAVWISNNMPGKDNAYESIELISNINLSDLHILSLHGYNKNYYVHRSQTITNKSKYSKLYIFIIVLITSYSDLVSKLFFKNSKINLYILCNIILKLNYLRKSANQRSQNEWFKYNVCKSSLIDLSSYGILIGLSILKFLINEDMNSNTNLTKGLGILSSLIMFSSIIPSIIIMYLWIIDIIKYYSKIYNNIINLLLSHMKIKIFRYFSFNKTIAENCFKDNNTINTFDCGENCFGSVSNEQFTKYIENNKSESSLISNAILNAAKPIAELNVLNFTFLYDNIPIASNTCYIPIKQYKKLLYYFGQLNELPNWFELFKNSNLTICPTDEFIVNADLTNFFATIEISRPPEISKSLPNMHNNCISLDIKLPKALYDETNRLYDVVYDYKNHMLIISGPFITPSGIFTLRAGIKNEYKNDSDTNFVTSMMADTCKCHYHGILNVPINPDYIKFLSRYNKIHIWRHSAGKSISFTINPMVSYVEINTVSNYMILKNQNFIEGSIYKVQYKCLPNKTNLGFMETVMADENISKIKIPISIPKEHFNHQLYEYHVTNSIDITCSITPKYEEIWGFHDEFISKIINSYPKVWGLSNTLDYKVPCFINKRLEDGFYRVTPKYGIAASIAEAQKEELIALYSTLIFNRTNSLEFAGFYFYDKEEINEFFNNFGIVLQIKDKWINPMSDCTIKMYGNEKMQKAYNALYLDLKSKLEFYINLSEQIVSHLWNMESLYDQDIILEAIDAFDKLTLNNICIESAKELVLKRVSRDIPQDLIKKLLFPPVISGKDIKWNLNLSNQLDAWKSEIKSFFDIKIGVLNSFSMLTSSYTVPLDFTLSCLGNSLRKLSNEFSLESRINGSNCGYELTHIVITEKSLVSEKNDWNIRPNYLHTTSFNTIMGYVKINDPYDLLDTWYPTFLNWKPHGLIFDIINVDKVYVKFTDISSIELDYDLDNCSNEPGVFNGLFVSEKMNILSLTCKNNSFKTLKIESSDTCIVNKAEGFVYKHIDSYKMYFKTTCSNNKCLEMILEEYTANSKNEYDNMRIINMIENKKKLQIINEEEIGSDKKYVKEFLQESSSEIMNEENGIESELRLNESELGLNENADETSACVTIESEVNL